jgi:uncharacterized protein
MQNSHRNPVLVILAFLAGSLSLPASAGSRQDYSGKDTQKRGSGALIINKNVRIGLAGTWQGDLQIGNGMKLPLVFHFQESNGKYKGTMDSPSQSSAGTAFDAVCLEGGVKLRATINKLNACYEGNLDPAGETLSGTWQQGPGRYPLTLKATAGYHGPARPQEPKPPFPYRSEPVQFDSGDARISGTLTLPASGAPFPAVVLIHGSGPHDRDETIMSHRPFLLIADYLTRRGTAVLRYDKRGCGKSTGSYQKATSRDFADDALKAVAYLKSRPDIKADRIGLIGHSEGGVIAPMVAGESDDLKYIVTLAGSVFPGDEILISQIKALSAGQGASRAETDRSLEIARQTYAIVKAETNDQAAIEKIKDMRRRLHAPEYTDAGSKNKSDEANMEAGLKVMTSPWYRFFLSFDPRLAWHKVHCPVLALYGEKDCQVNAQANLPALREALNAAGNNNFSEVKLAGLNHLFQTCKTGLPEEYGSIEETMSPSALSAIGDWIAGQNQPSPAGTQEESHLSK